MHGMLGAFEVRCISKNAFKGFSLVKESIIIPRSKLQLKTVYFLWRIPSFLKTETYLSLILASPPLVINGRSQMSQSDGAFFKN